MRSETIWPTAPPEKKAWNGRRGRSISHEKHKKENRQRLVLFLLVFFVAIPKHHPLKLFSKLGLSAIFRSENRKVIA
jgi:hypothetical protein